MMRFLFRLISPRPTFPMDMTDSERKVMGEHVTYWTALRDKGIATVFLDQSSIPKASGSRSC
jgi:hypothetical protein